MGNGIHRDWVKARKNTQKTGHFAVGGGVRRIGSTKSYVEIPENGTGREETNGVRGYSEAGAYLGRSLELDTPKMAAKMR